MAPWSSSVVACALIAAAGRSRRADSGGQLAQGSTQLLRGLRNVPFLEPPGGHPLERAPSSSSSSSFYPGACTTAPPLFSFFIFTPVFPLFSSQTFDISLPNFSFLLLILSSSIFYPSLSINCYLGLSNPPKWVRSFADIMSLTDQATTAPSWLPICAWFCERSREVPTGRCLVQSAPAGRSRVFSVARAYCMGHFNERPYRGGQKY